MTNLVLDTMLAPQQREFLAIVRDSGYSLLTLINDILDFSKIEAGKLDLERVDFTLSPILEGTAELLQTKAREKGIGLMTLIDSHVPPVVCGDPVRLRQILLNLVGNAIKFTNQGEVVIRAVLEADLEAETIVRFSVTDTGIGLSPTARNQLFQAFTQADGSTTRKYGGTGLGLSISKRLVEMMGGQINVDSTEGQGSVFWFTVRLGKAIGKPVSPVSAAASLQNGRVLVIEDSASQREIIQTYLHSWGIRNDGVASGPEAFSLLHQAVADDPYTIAIIDLQLPGMDGCSLASALRQDDKLNATKLVALTTFDDPNYVDHAEHAGVDAYITAPVKQSMLLEALLSVVNVVHAAVGQPTYADALPLTDPAQANVERGLILVAEDNPINQRVAVLQLHKLGYSVDHAANGREAIQAVQRKCYAAVLMDCQMPEVDGFAATAAIRANEVGTPMHLPIIAMTANAIVGDREVCLAAGMDDYISKPVDQIELGRILDRWTGMKLSTDETAFPRTASSPEEDTVIRPESPQVIDEQVLESLRGFQEPGEPDFVGEIVEIFSIDTSEQLQAMHKALADGDMATLQRAAHTVKGSAGNLGAVTLAALAKELEHLGGNAPPERVVQLVSELEAEFERVGTALRHYVENCSA